MDEKLLWHLVRSSGMVAYVLLLASTVWDLFISSQFVRDWSPGPVSMTLLQRRFVAGASKRA